MCVTPDLFIYLFIYLMSVSNNLSVREGISVLFFYFHLPIFDKESISLGEIFERENTYEMILIF